MDASVIKVHQTLYMCIVPVTRLGSAVQSCGSMGRRSVDHMDHLWIGHVGHGPVHVDPWPTIISSA